MIAIISKTGKILKNLFLLPLRVVSSKHLIMPWEKNCFLVLLHLPKYLHTLLLSVTKWFFSHLRPYFEEIRKKLPKLRHSTKEIPSHLCMHIIQILKNGTQQHSRLKCTKIKCVSMNVVAFEKNYLYKFPQFF